jgi:hypothetical protein
MENKLQVNATHYRFDNYVDIARWNSYYYQIVETMAFEPETVLIIGVGDNIVGQILQYKSIKVYTLDYDVALNPDFVGSIADIDVILQNQRFDVVLCCQVLEHLPFDLFEKTIQKMKNISDNVIISLPYEPLYCKIDIEMTRVSPKRINIDIPQFFRKYKFNGEHYWEIGVGTHSKHEITSIMEKQFKIKKQFIVPHNHFHYFYILVKK